MSSNVLLVDPYVEYPSVYNSCSFNIGLLSIASHCLNTSMRVSFAYHSESLASRYHRVKSLGSTLEEFKPNLVLISSITAGWYSANEIAKAIKRSNPATTVAVGGVFPTPVASVIQDRFKHFDLVAKGEGELSVANVISEFLVSGHFRTGVLPCEGNTEIPEIDLSLISHFSKAAQELPFPIEIGRGCLYRCTFCYLRDFHRPLRLKAHQKVLSESRELSNLGVKTLFVSDDNLDPNSSHARRLLSHFASLGFRTVFETRLEFLGRTLMRDLKRRKVSEVIYGVEHIDSQILSSMRKCANVEGHRWRTLARKVTEELTAAGITAHPIFMLGWPGETMDTLQQVTDFACSLGKTDNTEPFVSFATPHPGTRFRRLFKDEFSSMAKDLRKYMHILPVSTPKSLGPNALSLLVEAHNRIRVESDMTQRNPTISAREIMSYWGTEDYTNAPFCN